MAPIHKHEELLLVSRSECLHDKFREVNTREKKLNQRKHVHEHFRLINKNELVEFLLALSGDLFRVIHALQIGMSISIHGLSITSFLHYRAHSLHCYTFLEKAKHSRITCNGTVWELNVTSLPCWLSCYSFLPHKLSELLSWIRNLRKTRIHSIPQFFCSRLQYEKEIRNNEHRREFSQKKYINRYFDHLATILPSTYFSSEGLFCFCFYVY